MTTPTDPDLQHLADLLDFLPGPDNRDFWGLVDGKGHVPAADSHVDRMLGSLVVSLLVLRAPNPVPGHVVGMVERLMTLFGGDHPGLQQLLDRHAANSLPHGMFGSYWVEDLRSTCWRLYVRYSANGSWSKKWPSSFDEWRKARDGQKK